MRNCKFEFKFANNPNHINECMLDDDLKDDFDEWNIYKFYL